MVALIRVLFMAVGVSFLGLFIVVLLTALFEPVVTRFRKVEARRLAGAWSSLVTRIEASWARLASRTAATD